VKPAWVRVSVVAFPTKGDIRAQDFDAAEKGWLLDRRRRDRD